MTLPFIGAESQRSAPHHKTRTASCRACTNLPRLSRLGIVTCSPNGDIHAARRSGGRQSSGTTATGARQPRPTRFLSVTVERNRAGCRSSMTSVLDWSLHGGRVGDGGGCGCAPIHVGSLSVVQPGVRTWMGVRGRYSCYKKVRPDGGRPFFRG